jgi:hypothetical protein
MNTPVRINWEKQLHGDSDAFVGDQRVATIKKLGNHSSDRTDVYASTVLGRRFRTHEKIAAARKEVEAEIMKRLPDAVPVSATA